jgi:hypothetical protein
MKANINDNPFIPYNTIPKTWMKRPNLVNYHLADPSIHFEDGFRDLVLPQLSSFEDRGQIRYSEVTDNFTYEVIPWTEERIKQQALEEAELKRQELFQLEAEKDLEDRIMTPIQALPDQEALDKQDIFPIWEKLEDGYPFVRLYKYQALLDGVLVLYRCEQAHAKQSDYHPSKLPALFTQIARQGEILPWKQPTGAQDAYQISDKVSHRALTWESINANNVWEPGVFGWQQI